MDKKSAIQALGKYSSMCLKAIENAEYDRYGNAYVSFPEYNLIKTSVVSLFKTLNVDDSFIDSILQFKRQTVYEIETIQKYISEVQSQIESEIYDKISMPLLKEYDVFLSHASKDKETFVEELYQELSKLNISIFYDKNSISWGDNWEDKINEALEKCEFAIVVISKNFFGRDWTEKELNTLLEKKNALGQKLILPIAHDVKINTIKKRYPKVASIQSLATNKYSQKDITILFAKELIERIKGRKAKIWKY